MSTRQAQSEIPTVASLLAVHGLTAADDSKFVFESELIRVADRIRNTYRTLPYDHRLDAPEYDRDFPYLFTEQFRRGYACFKHAVSLAIQPRSICEIGIGAGTAALAFLSATPSARYIGIDDGSKRKEDDYDFLGFVEGKLKTHGYSYEIWLEDSLTLKQAPTVDLFHVDGNHDYVHAYNDTKLAMLSGSTWVLIDDSRDFIVSSAALSAVRDLRESVGVNYDWTHFEDTWTGSLLIRRRGA